ncbi:hypothetical protein ACFO3J_24250 [Streptomyces polygonati]|uniref:Uncharacterized protein n=1 Tax=Streptomyces polygonati TaxID=1617087 RepID=A0ABV8HR96_9ACTN
MTDPAPLTPRQRLTELYALAGYGRRSEQLAADLLAEHEAETAAAKVSPAGAEATLSSDVLAFLTAVRDALTVPHAARAADLMETLERRQRRDELVADRAATVRIAANVAIDLAGRPADGDLLCYLTQTIRDGIAAFPVDYQVRQDKQPAGGEQA